MPAGPDPMIATFLPVLGIFFGFFTLSLLAWSEIALSNALKPIVLPGETMEVRISKEGKEFNQGVAYLDDGTMVVVDNSRSLIGQVVKVVVTSVLQTSAGRMIFAKPEDAKGGWKGR